MHLPRFRVRTMLLSVALAGILEETSIVATGWIASGGPEQVAFAFRIYFEGLYHYGQYLWYGVSYSG